MKEEGAVGWRGKGSSSGGEVQREIDWKGLARVYAAIGISPLSYWFLNGQRAVSGNVLWIAWRAV